MPYMGNPLATAFSTINKQTITGNGTVGPYTLDYAAGSDQDVEVFVNNVRQEPGVAYTVAGTSMTMTGVVQSSDDFYVVFQGKAQQTVSHPAGSPLQATSGTFSGDLTVDTSTLKVDSTNNRVGIANASPSVELDVTGAAKVSGDLTVDSNTLYVDSTNNRVGIGDSSPSAKLDVYSTSGSTTDIGRFEAAVGGYTGTSLIAANTIGPDSAYNLFKCITDSDGDAGGPYTEFVVRGDGNVGIGQSSPATPLHINGAPGTTTLRLDAGGTLGGARRNWGISAEKYAAGALTIEYGSTEGAAPSNAAMTIDSGGGVLINTTSAVGAGGPRLSMAFNGSTTWLANTNDTNGTSGARHFTFHSSGTEVGRITTTTSATTYTSTSDYRLKENVVADWDATTRLKQLNPVRFNFIADPDTTVDGFLAHEVQDIVPEAISGEKDAMRDEEYEVTPAVLDEDGNEVTPAVMGTRSVPDYQGIDQSKLVPLLVKTIQELEARITALENA